MRSNSKSTFDSNWGPEVGLSVKCAVYRLDARAAPAKCGRGEKDSNLAKPCRRCVISADVRLRPLPSRKRTDGPGPLVWIAATRFHGHSDQARRLAALHGRTGEVRKGCLPPTNICSAKVLWLCQRTQCGWAALAWE